MLNLDHVISYFCVQAVKHQDQLQEASMDLINKTLDENRLTLIAFSGFQKHYEVEEIMAQVTTLIYCQM